MATVAHWKDAPPQERDAVELVIEAVESWEQGFGSEFRDRCNRRYQQYRGFSKFKHAWEVTGPNDKDLVLAETKKTWGANLHIPLSFRTIETMVPRAIAHRPKMLYLPRRERWAQNVQNVRLLIDSQQEQIDIDLPFQAVMRSGRIYGIGWGKTFWRTEYAMDRRVKRRTVRLPGQSEFVVPRARSVKTFDDPDFEDLDVFDVMWDPAGHDPKSCRWMVHRLWMGLDEIMGRIKSGDWSTRSAQSLTEEDVRALGGDRGRYDEIWSERMAASGFSTWQLSSRGEYPQEVLEFHDGTQVFSVLGRQVCVQAAENPCVGHKPFSAYRPTPLQKQMLGIGDLEPLEHLQKELDTLRSQRRDAATIALCAGYAFDDGAIDEEDLTFGPAAAIRVTNANPRDALMPLQIRDVPGSGYQEEQVIRTDFDAVSGISDALQPEQPGQRSGSGTATEAQLVQAALSRRIELASRRFEVEVVRSAARLFLKLNQRMITKPRDPIRQPDESMDAYEAAQEGRWKWFPIGPGELQGEYEIVPEGGSMAARNVPQDRQDAIQLMNLFGRNPHIDERRPLLKALSLFGVEDPESWLKQSEPPVPPMALEFLARAGIDKGLIDRAMMLAQRADPRLPDDTEQGPDVAAVDQMMGSQNGNGAG